MNKNKIALLVDSGTDVPMEYRKKYGIYWLPLLINYSDRQYLDGVDIDPTEMYERLPVEIPKTSLPNHGMVSEMFDRIRADGVMLTKEVSSHSATGQEMSDAENSSELIPSETQ